MNTLILSPDGVGGTLLERLLTVYMQFHEFDHPVINVSHPECGLQIVYNDDFNQPMLSKPDTTLGSYEPLDQIIKMYKQVDHYTVTKIGSYTMCRRQDPQDQILPFYRYFDDNFYTIACRRRNIFEHALSWAISKVTKAKNVYSHGQKIETFIDLYRDRFEIDPQSLLDTLENYEKFLIWCDKNFSVASYYYYEDQVASIEQYILSLPLFNGQKKKHGWKDVFGNSFLDWNRCHFFASDIGSVALANDTLFPDIVDNIKTMPPNRASAALSWTTSRQLIKSYNDCKDPSWPQISSIAEFDQLPETIKQECKTQHNLELSESGVDLHRNLSSWLPQSHINHIQQHATAYLKAIESLERMQKLGILSGIPIKKQTLTEKRYMIKNFDQCLHTYNDWIDRHPDIGSTVTYQDLEDSQNLDSQNWFMNRNDRIKLQ